jgi:uncharacterized protein
MIFFDTEVLKSSIEGLGLFAKKFIPAGSVVGNMAHSCEYISEEEYCREQEAGNERVIQTGIRLAGSNFIYNANRESGKLLYLNEDFINHNEDPSLLYHCGLIFALRDVNPGDELTVNYKYFFSEHDATSFQDSRTGRQVYGLNSHEALLESTLELAKLLMRRPALDRTAPRSRPAIADQAPFPMQS